MLFDILFVFVVSLISSLCFCTTSVHGFPTPSSSTSSSSSSIDHYLHHHPSVAAADSSSSLRLFRHQPVPSVDYDLGGDIAEMLIGESNEYNAMPDDDDDDDDDDTAIPPYLSTLDQSNTDLIHSLSRKLFLSTAKHRSNQNHNDKQEHKRLSPSTLSTPPGQFNLKSAFPTDQLNSNNIVNLSRLSESTRLSPSLQILVETNPFARAWLTMLLQKVMEEQPVPYIFKYGRRRK